jgi:hypothetical protein
MKKINVIQFQDYQEEQFTKRILFKETDCNMKCDTC